MSHRLSFPEFPDNWVDHYPTIRKSQTVANAPGPEPQPPIPRAKPAPTTSSLKPYRIIRALGSPQLRKSLQRSVIMRYIEHPFWGLVVNHFPNGECWRVQKWRGIPVPRAELRLILVFDQDESLQLKNGRFSLRRDLVEKGEIISAKAAFRDFYVTKGQERLTSCVDYYAPKASQGRQPCDGTARSARSIDPNTSALPRGEAAARWASCPAARKLSFHWKCMMTPLSIIDYIVVHELCHIHHAITPMSFGMRSIK